jgi:hypothetical protein
MSADMALPARQPIEGLEHGAIGPPFEVTPILLDRRQILVNGETNVAGERFGRRYAHVIGGRRTIDVEMGV